MNTRIRSIVSGNLLTTRGEGHRAILLTILLAALFFGMIFPGAATVYAQEDPGQGQVREGTSALQPATELKWMENVLPAYKPGSGVYQCAQIKTPSGEKTVRLLGGYVPEEQAQKEGDRWIDWFTDSNGFYSFATSFVRFLEENGAYSYRIYSTNDENDLGTGQGVWSEWSSVLDYEKPATAFQTPTVRWCTAEDNVEGYTEESAIMIFEINGVVESHVFYEVSLYKNGNYYTGWSAGSSRNRNWTHDWTSVVNEDKDAVWTLRGRIVSGKPDVIAHSEWSEMSPSLFGNTMPEVPEYTLSGRVIKISEVLAYYSSAGERVVLQEVGQYGVEPLRNETTWRIGTPGSNLADGRYIIRDGDVVINDTGKEMYFISSDLMVLAGGMPVGNKVYFAEEYVEPGFRNEAYNYISYRGKDWTGDAIVSIGENVITIDSISGDPSKAKNYDGSGTADVNSQPDTATGRWVNQDDGWWFAYSGGGYPAGTWEKINGAWYYFDGSGWMQTGWTEVNGTWYYMNGDGAMQIGWVKSGDDWYYLDPASGAMATGWVDDNGTWYYMEDSGAMKTGWVKSGNDWYYLNNKGAMVTGWVEVDDTWYYMEDSGAMATGWVKSGNDWYYLNNEGAMATGWVDDNGTWYYMEDSGAMKTGWVQIGKDWYYLNPASGAMMTGWVEDGAWYYMDDDGAMTVGWVKDGGIWYYMDTSGAMISNTSRRIDGKTYNFDRSGACTNP